MPAALLIKKIGTSVILYQDNSLLTSYYDEANPIRNFVQEAEGQIRSVPEIF